MIMELGTIDPPEVKAVTDLFDLETVIAEVTRALLFKAMMERPSEDEREALSEDFARDTVRLVLTAAANNEALMYDEVGEYDHVITNTLN